jgi:NAD(P)-dependent dehydrogenase (short-subunit alcohol dehydrogenase family)
MLASAGRGFEELTEEGAPMTGRLEGKVAVVTGGASGMGRSTVFRFLAEGARVVVADLNEETGKETVELAGARGASDRVRFVRTDVAEESDVERMIALAVSDFGRLDCVFNNAGIGGALGSVLETEAEDWDFTFAVLVRAVFLGIKHGGRVLKEQGEGGSIINTASVAGLSGGAGPVAYSAAKAAVINLSRAAAVELAEHRIRVNAICPGGILTPLIHRGNEAVARERLAKLQPWPAAGTGDHIAGAALFLAGDDSEFVTGEALVVDGGLEAQGPSLPRRMREENEQLRAFDFVGVDKGSTGLPPVVRKLGTDS